MTPEQAWQATLFQLQMEMPKATFDTWVRNARFLDYEAGLLTLGFENSYARDWVEARLSSMIRRILVGILACEVALRFEVIAPRHGSETAHDEAVNPPGETDSDKDDENAEVLVQLDLARQSLYETMVQPERVTVIPGYFLRWLPYLGHQQSWMIVALWQIFFQTCGHKASPGKPFSASGTDIARWAGLSRRTVVTHLNTLASEGSHHYLSWFVERVDDQPQIPHNGQATRFRFKATMPLTPGDANRLREELCQLGIAENPVVALKAALTRQPKDLLPFPAPRPSEPDAPRAPTPASVQQIVLSLAGLTPKHAQYVEILQLAGELAGRLMPPKDVLVISHYFLLNWLPRLGSGPGWLVTFLRDEGYYDRKTGELRDKIRLEEGYSELARRLGLERENTVGDWLPTTLQRYGPEKKGPGTRQDRREALRADIAQFLTKTNFRIDHTGKHKTTWELHLKMTEPLIPDHQHLHDGLLEVAREAFLKKDRTSLDWLLDGQELGLESETDFDTSEGDHHAAYPGQEPVTTRFAQEVPRDLHTSANGHRASFTGSPRELHKETGMSPRVMHTLKHLINQHFSKAQESFREVLTTACQPLSKNEPNQAAGVVYTGKELWDFEHLLTLDGTPERRRKEICKKIAVRPNLGLQLLAWLLYAYHHRKTPERKSGIESPFGYALSRYEKLLPTTEFMEIANHTPRELHALLQYPHKAWDLPHSTQNILKTLTQNGFLSFVEELCEVPTC